MISESKNSLETIITDLIVVSAWNQNRKADRDCFLQQPSYLSIL
jgi:hypothetical protein